MRPLTVKTLTGFTDAGKSSSGRNGRNNARPQTSSELRLLSGFTSAWQRTTTTTGPPAVPPEPAPGQLELEKYNVEAESREMWNFVTIVFVVIVHRQAERERGYEHMTHLSAVEAMSLIVTRPARPCSRMRNAL